VLAETGRIWRPVAFMRRCLAGGMVIAICVMVVLAGGLVSWFVFGEHRWSRLIADAESVLVAIVLSAVFAPYMARRLQERAGSGAGALNSTRDGKPSPLGRR
jgi:hypothetical protein